MILGLTGYARSGKDSVGQILVDNGYRRLAFADGVRDALYVLNPIVRVETVKEFEDDGNMCWGFGAERQIKTLRTQTARVQDIVKAFGWEVAKTQFAEVRELLQRMGTEVGRDLFGENVWVNRVAAQIVSEQNYVITDVRFPNEAAWLKEVGGRLIRIIRPGVEAVNTHVSDAGIDQLIPDEWIDNNGTLDQLQQVVELSFL